MEWMPAMEERTNQGVQEVSLRTRLLGEGTILLTGEITNEAAVTFLTEMLCLGNMDHPVRILINSPGGSVNAGLMIYDLIRSEKVPMDLYCTGMAASMAAVIFAAGPKGHRFILPHSSTMIHEPLIADGGVGGSATSIRNISDSIIKTREIMNKILSECTGRDVEEINQATSFDHYMNAKESVDFGLCDAVVDRVI